MLGRDDIHELSEANASERVFLSVYLSGRRSVEDLEERLTVARSVLQGGSPERSEREHFDENAKLVRKLVGDARWESPSLCVFVGWAVDFIKVVELEAPVPDIVWVDSSPYVRPLVEADDEYENVAVVVADNERARVYLVSCESASTEKTIVGNVKNHVRKGGWSQQRYERRRDKQLLLYARNVVAALQRLEREENFRRIVLVGGREILQAVRENLPKAMAGKALTQAVDLNKGDSYINDEIRALFVRQERASEADLWERIRTQILRDGLGVSGIAAVWDAAKNAQVEEAVVLRGLSVPGIRCRDCESLSLGANPVCANCGGESVFGVDAVNEVVERVMATGARVDFCDPLPTLVQAGGVAALLRY
ncbi:MAG: hypothetical protein HN742_07780 [Lentisphaerae bacterium]|jgi:peptide subunit release factor 1 (eRF1)|nr:hypothetical protein [Lentisphaerota bacterium]MBT4815149.1 hypothetical protein [Lentisphaerota bacterium]MBT5611574.1 hypothetical protein [Lentisphaerota bacterium]MBT7057380.1 hypothetical protein [Lentisphaerota bacterium]MBT7841756.1 hypothetical protein [Lentisphaerota bacterium]